MTATDPGTRIESAVTDALEQVFADVRRIHDAVLAAHAAGPAGPDGSGLTDEAVTALRPMLLGLLTRPDQLAVGVGFIVEPGLIPDAPLRLEWWQLTTGGRGGPTPLEADLNPDSLGFYDYAAADWFARPRRTGHRHVLGPYVDVHGTDRYMLTLTVPVVAHPTDQAHPAHPTDPTDPAAPTFLGVAGADVPVARFERIVLGAAGRPDGHRSEPEDPVVLVNAEGRVVLSTSGRWLPGDLVTDDPGDAPGLAALPWRIVRPGT